MKKIIFAALSLTVALAAIAQDEKGATKLMQPNTNTYFTPIVPPPVYIQPPVYGQTPPPANQQVYVYDQKPVEQPPALVSASDAQITMDAFRTNYQKLGNPRILIYVNRDLVDEQSGLKLSGRSETVKSRRVSDPNSTNNSTTTETEAKNNYYNNGQAAQPTL